MTDLKLKLITYPTTSALMGACTAFIAAFVFHFTIIYAVLLGIGGALVTSCVARITVHMNQGDYSGFMFQVAIYHMIIAIGWFTFVLADSWWATSFGLAVVVGATMMCLFTRFLESPKGKIFMIMEEKERTERFFPEGDVPGAPEDKARPVCCIDGVCLTIAEA